MKRLIVVFGAAVRSDGSASPTLRRRTATGARLALADPQAELFCSGAIGAYPPSEASVMVSLIPRAVSPARIHLDEASRDTVQTVAAATGFARANGFGECVACTDLYHQARVRMLFRLFGMAASSASGEERGPLRYRARMWARELAALPYDLVAGAWAVSRARRQSR